MKNFVLIGAAGYIAPRHMQAIKDTGNNLLAVHDPFDSVGIIDRYFPEADFFTEFERFDRHLEKLKRKGVAIDFVSICSPNYLHDAHIRFGLRLGASVICEKPIVLNPWNLAALIDLEKEYPGNIFNILQLRLHESVRDLKQRVTAPGSPSFHEVELAYFTSRGKWYHYSWKGDIAKSGGIATNIGIHFFDLLIWVFGPVREVQVFEHGPASARGCLLLERARVKWHLSVAYEQIPEAIRATGARTYRSLKIGEEEFEFSGGFTDLHTKSYEEILAGRGFRAAAAAPAIELVHQVRNADVVAEQ